MRSQNESAEMRALKSNAQKCNCKRRGQICQLGNRAQKCANLGCHTAKAKIALFSEEAKTNCEFVSSINKKGHKLHRYLELSEMRCQVAAESSATAEAYFRAMFLSSC